MLLDNILKACALDFMVKPVETTPLEVRVSFPLVVTFITYLKAWLNYNSILANFKELIKQNFYYR
tara:strand:+ start:1595 stop:1789 length:195 start_codon:yes stop_codon:yes gene_type:complete